MFQPYRYVSPSPRSVSLLSRAPHRPAALQVVRSARAKVDDRRRGDPRFRTRINDGGNVVPLVHGRLLLPFSRSRYNPPRLLSYGLAPPVRIYLIVPCSTHVILPCPLSLRHEGVLLYCFDLRLLAFCIDFQLEYENEDIDHSALTREMFAKRALAQDWSRHVGVLAYNVFMDD
jgi:hypothetical protein